MEIYCVDKIFLLIVISIFKMTWTKHTFGCARLGKATLGSICDGKLVNNWFKSRLTIILVCSIIAHLTSLIIVFSVAAIRYQIVVCCWDPKLTRYMNTPLFHATPGLIGEFPLVLSWISPFLWIFLCFMQIKALARFKMKVSIISRNWGFSASRKVFGNTQLYREGFSLPTHN